MEIESPSQQIPTQNIWNIKKLEPPPIATYKSNNLIEINELWKHVKKALHFFSNQAPLEKEAALLSRCIYRMKMKFRSDNGLRAMEKVNRALLQYNGLKFQSTLDDFLSVLSDNRCEGGSYLPTRNMIDYILVRLQGIVSLMLRVKEMAEFAADNMGSRISIGHFWKVAAIILGIVSRIWILSNTITQQACQFYRDIKPMRDILRNIGNDWIPKDYVFPDSLQVWVGITTAGIDVNNIKLITDEVPLIEIMESSDIEEGEEYVQVTDSDDDCNVAEVNEVVKGDIANMFDVLMQDEDLGVVLKEENKRVINICSDSDDGLVSIELRENDDIQLQTDQASEAVNSTKSSKIKRKNKRDKKINTQVPLEVKEKLCLKKKKIKKNLKKQVSCDIIDNISSLKELKSFLARMNEGLYNVEKLKSNMIGKHIRKSIRKANKNGISDIECLERTKTILKANFL